MKPLTYHESIRILLDRVCGINQMEVQREAGMSRQAVVAFMAGRGEYEDRTINKLGMFVWRRMNAHLLMSDAELGLPVVEVNLPDIEVV